MRKQFWSPFATGITEVGFGFSAVESEAVTSNHCKDCSSCLFCVSSLKVKLKSPSSVGSLRGGKSDILDAN